MVIIPLQTKNYNIYDINKPIEVYRKELESLVDRFISTFGDFEVKDGKLWLSPIWGEDLADAAKGWFIEGANNIYVFREKIIDWLFENKEQK